MFIGSVSLFKSTHQRQALIQSFSEHHPNRTLLLRAWHQDSDIPVTRATTSYFKSKEELISSGNVEEVFTFVSQHLSFFTKETVSKALTKIADLIYPADLLPIDAECRIIQKPSGEFDFQASPIIRGSITDEEWEKVLDSIKVGSDVQKKTFWDRLLGL